MWSSVYIKFLVVVVVMSLSVPTWLGWGSPFLWQLLQVAGRLWWTEHQVPSKMIKEIVCVFFSKKETKTKLYETPQRGGTALRSALLPLPFVVCSGNSRWAGWGMACWAHRTGCDRSHSWVVRAPQTWQEKKKSLNAIRDSTFWGIIEIYNNL